MSFTEDPIKAPKWLAADLGVSLATFWRMRREGRYPELVTRGRGRRGQFLSVHEAAKRAIAERGKDDAAAPAPAAS